MAGKGKQMNDTQVDYVATFTSENGMRVLDDIKHFCMWGKSPYDRLSFRDTDRAIAYQEVVMHILDMMGGSYDNTQTEVMNDE